MVKQTLKRRKPGFNESYHRFRGFGQLLEEAEDRKLLDLELYEKSGGYIITRLLHEDCGAARLFPRQRLELLGRRSDRAFQVHLSAKQLARALCRDSECRMRIIQEGAC